MSNGSYQNGKLPASALAPIYQGNLTKEAAAGWNAMNVEARKRGVQLYPTGSKSSYRTYEQQVELYNAYLNGTGNLAAVPGTSNHGWGNAVDLATTQMRSTVDAIGAQFGYSKSWSDAPSEWWHVVYQSGHYSGPDPGPDGKGAPAPTPEPITEDDMITAVLKKNGAIEVFVEKGSGNNQGTVYHTWQSGENGKWYTTDGGKSIAWQGMGNPGSGGK
jgi:hypothetical protein